MLGNRAGPISTPANAINATLHITDTNRPSVAADHLLAHIHRTAILVAHLHDMTLPKIRDITRRKSRDTQQSYSREHQIHGMMA